MDRLGGNQAVGGRLGIHPTQISAWRKINRIPTTQVLKVWEMAMEGFIPWHPPGAERLVRLIALEAIAHIARADAARALDLLPAPTNALNPGDKG